MTAVRLRRSVFGKMKSQDPTENPRVILIAPQAKKIVAEDKESETEPYVGPQLSSPLYQVKPSEMMKLVRKEIRYLGIAR